MKKTFLRRGFTLIELMVVIAVIGILATIALFGIGKAQAAARDTQRAQIMNSVRAALERYYGDNNTYPTGAWVAVVGTTLSTYLNTALNDPGCGTGVSDVRTMVTPTGCTGVSYAYTKGTVGTCANANGYGLTLVKEGGGTQYFCSPQ